MSLFYSTRSRAETKNGKQIELCKGGERQGGLVTAFAFVLPPMDAKQRHNPGNSRGGGFWSKRPEKGVISLREFRGSRKATMLTKTHGG